MKAYRNPELTILKLTAEDVLSTSETEKIPDILAFGGDNEAPAMSLLP